MDRRLRELERQALVDPAKAYDYLYAVQRSGILDIRIGIEVESGRWFDRSGKSYEYRYVKPPTASYTFKYTDSPYVFYGIEASMEFNRTSRRVKTKFTDGSVRNITRYDIPSCIYIYIYKNRKIFSRRRQNSKLQADASNSIKPEKPQYFLLAAY